LHGVVFAILRLEIEFVGGQALVHIGDVADANAVQAMAEAVNGQAIHANGGAYLGA